MPEARERPAYTLPDQEKVRESMELPLQITYRGVGPSKRLNQLIRKEGMKLEHFFSRIVSCRVLVEREPRHLKDRPRFTCASNWGFPATSC